MYVHIGYKCKFISLITDFWSSPCFMKAYLYHDNNLFGIDVCNYFCNLNMHGAYASSLIAKKAL